MIAEGDGGMDAEQHFIYFTGHSFLDARTEIFLPERENQKQFWAWASTSCADP